MSTELEQWVASIRCRLTPAYVQAEVQDLLRRGQDVGGGVNVARLIRRWIGERATDVEVTRVYAQLKSALAEALDAIPSLVFFEGD